MSELWTAGFKSKNGRFLNKIAKWPSVYGSCLHFRTFLFSAFCLQLCFLVSISIFVFSIWFSLIFQWVPLQPPLALHPPRLLTIDANSWRRISRSWVRSFGSSFCFISEPFCVFLLLWLARELRSVQSQLHVAQKNLETAASVSEQHRQHAESAQQEKVAMAQHVKDLEREVQNLKNELRQRDREIRAHERQMSQLSSKLNEQKEKERVAPPAPPAPAAPVPGSAIVSMRGGVTKTASELQNQNSFLQRQLDRLEKQLAQYDKQRQEDKDQWTQNEASLKEQVSALTLENKKLRLDLKRFESFAHPSGSLSQPQLPVLRGGSRDDSLTPSRIPHVVSSSPQLQQHSRSGSISNEIDAALGETRSRGGTGGSSSAASGAFARAGGRPSSASSSNAPSSSSAASITTTAPRISETRSSSLRPMLLLLFLLLEQMKPLTNWVNYNMTCLKKNKPSLNCVLNSHNYNNN